ncbi:MAG: WG repeat-containing protein [Methanomassiliicoccales archaeon]
MRALKIVFWMIILSLVVGAGSTFSPDLIAMYHKLKADYEEASKPVPSYKVDNNLFRGYRPTEFPDNNFVLELHPGQTVELKNRLISNMSRDQEAKLTITPHGLMKAEYRRNSAGETIIKPNETINIKLYADVPTYLKVGDYQASLDVEWHQPGGDIPPAMIKDLSFTMRVLPNDLDMNRFNNDRGKWGFIDRFSNVIIPPQFDQVGSFKEGVCPVMLNGRWGYIDDKGNYVIVPKYPEAQPFTSGVAGVRVAANQWGYINRQDVFIMKPIYTSGTAFVYAGGNQAIVKTQDGKWYYIDKAGKQLRSAPAQTN